MAKFRTIISQNGVSLLIAFAMILLLISSLLTIILIDGETSFYDVLSDRYVWNVLLFSIFQAFLSAFFATLIGAIFSKLIVRTNFVMQKSIYTLFGLIFVLPTLVAISGLISIFGANGWLKFFYEFLGFDWNFKIYGLQGILLAHLFFNIPFAARLIYQALLQVPEEYVKLSALHKINGIRYFYAIEWHFIKNALKNAFLLIFMFCFSSFAIILTLGKSPEYTGFEVAIYESIMNFELTEAKVLTVMQLILGCFVISFLAKTDFLHQNPSKNNDKKTYVRPISSLKKMSYQSAILVVLLFLLAPMIAIIIDGLIALLTIKIPFSSLFNASLNSLVIAFFSSFLAVFVSYLMSYSALRLTNYFPWLSKLLLISPLLILAIPNMILSVGLFLIFMDYLEYRMILIGLVILSHIILLQPIIFKQLYEPMTRLFYQYNKINQLNPLSLWKYFYYFDFLGLKKIFIAIFALSFLISMGDFGIIALIGGHQFATLPFLLHEQIGHYQTDNAAFTALIFLLLSFGLMRVINIK